MENPERDLNDEFNLKEILNSLDDSKPVKKTFILTSTAAKALDEYFTNNSMFKERYLMSALIKYHLEDNIDKFNYEVIAEELNEFDTESRTIYLNESAFEILERFFDNNRMIRNKYLLSALILHHSHIERKKDKWLGINRHKR